MSDIVVRLKRQAELEHIGGFSGGLFEEAADEIERLRERLERMRKIADENVKGREAAEQRIGELEEAYRVATSTEHLPPGCGKHIITTEQISAAWAVFAKSHQAIRPFNVLDFERLFAELGIVRCEGCGGIGSVALDDERLLHGPFSSEGKCTDCDGHRWVVKHG